MHTITIKKPWSAFIRTKSTSVCVVGSGPAGYYATAALLKNPNFHFDITILDKQFTPFGLVRTGVAPDHPEVKLVENRFSEISNEPNVSFYGNVEVGKDISLEELKKYFSIIIFAYGCNTPKKLNIPGENCIGVNDATDFTNWYNAVHYNKKPNSLIDLSGDSAVIIGNGNVAIDVARILSKTVDDLRETDIPLDVLEELSHSKIKNIHIVGRRGPVQAAFSTAELRELASVSNIILDPKEWKEAVESNETQEELKDRLNARKFKLLENLFSQKKDDKKKNVHFHFLASPISFSHDEKNILTGVNFERTKLTGPSHNQKAVSAGNPFNLETNTAFLSLGFKGKAIPGLPFNEREALLYNKNGRLYDPESGSNYYGLYSVGWIKKGPSGIIGSNIPDANDTVDTIFGDIQNNLFKDINNNSDPKTFLKKLNYIDWQEWTKLDQFEKVEGKKYGKIREKVKSIDRALEIVKE